MIVSEKCEKVSAFPTISFQVLPGIHITTIYRYPK